MCEHDVQNTWLCTGSFVCSPFTATYWTSWSYGTHAISFTVTMKFLLTTIIFHIQLVCSIKTFILWRLLLHIQLLFIQVKSREWGSENVLYLKTHIYTFYIILLFLFKSIIYFEYNFFLYFVKYKHRLMTVLIFRFKPVDVKQVLSPIRDEFEALFRGYFSVQQNHKFLEHVSVSELFFFMFAVLLWGIVCRTHYVHDQK